MLKNYVFPDKLAKEGLNNPNATYMGIKIISFLVLFVNTGMDWFERKLQQRWTLYEMSKDDKASWPLKLPSPIFQTCIHRRLMAQQLAFNKAFGQTYLYPHNELSVHPTLGGMPCWLKCRLLWSELVQNIGS